MKSPFQTEIDKLAKEMQKKQTPRESEIRDELSRLAQDLSKATPEARPAIQRKIRKKLIELEKEQKK